MPFFSRNSEPAHEPAPQVYEQPPKRHGLFGRDQQPVHQAPVYEEPPKRHGLFGRHRSPSPTPTNGTRQTASTYRTSPERDARSSSANRSLLRRSFGNGAIADMDPSIVAARERVMNAEAAERDADRALIAARESVREAREHVRRLELEAQEEARRAKIKSAQAKEMSKRGKQLGRHDY